MVDMLDRDYERNRERLWRKKPIDAILIVANWRVNGGSDSRWREGAAIFQFDRLLP
jgi:hypothetical protein